MKWPVFHQQLDGQRRRFGIAKIDVVNSTFQASTEPGRRSVAAFIDFVQTYFDEYEAMIPDCSPQAIVRKEGDGVVVCWECTDAKATDQFINAMDRLIALVPFFNRSVTNDELADARERIHIRIVCDIDEILMQEDFGAIVSVPAMGRIGEAEKILAVRDHVNLHRSVFDLLSGMMRERCREIGAGYYCLDFDQSRVTVRQNYDDQPGEADQLQSWIMEGLESGSDYELLIFSYTNEGLLSYFGSKDRHLMSKIKTRILMRNWVRETADQEEYEATRENAQSDGEWEKGAIIRTGYSHVVEQSRRVDDGMVDFRFYDDHPWIKGAIMECRSTKSSGEVVTRRRAYLGVYRHFTAIPEGHVSPFSALHWISLRLSDDRGVQSSLIDVFRSRFDLLWERGKTYEDVLDDEMERTNTRAAAKIWGTHKIEKYLAILPSRRTPERPIPYIVAEDYHAILAISDHIQRLGRKIEFAFLEIDAEGDVKPASLVEIGEKLSNWNGGVIMLCRIVYQAMRSRFTQLVTSAISLDRQSPNARRWVIRDNRAQQTLTSPLDKKPAIQKDMGIIARVWDESVSGWVFIVAGIHGIGTWGASLYLTDPATLSQLLGDLPSDVRDGDFSAVVESEYVEDALRIAHYRLYITPDRFRL